MDGPSDIYNTDTLGTTEPLLEYYSMHDFVGVSLQHKPAALVVREAARLRSAFESEHRDLQYKNNHTNSEARSGSPYHNEISNMRSLFFTNMAMYSHVCYYAISHQPSFP